MPERLPHYEQGLQSAVPPGLCETVVTRARFVVRWLNSDILAASRAQISCLSDRSIRFLDSAGSIASTSNQAARVAMNQLEQAGVLRRINVGKRNRAWEAVGLFDRLNAFERALATPAGAIRPKRPSPR